MPGPAPKHSSARARRNKTSTAAVLSPDHDVEAPELPAREWHDMTRVWWDDIWASPMAPEYDESDKHGLFQLALLVDDFWVAETSKERKELAAEIRQQGQRFGLSPIDRRRLQWEIERSEEARAKGAKRRGDPPPAPPAPSPPLADPRSVLRAV